MNTRVSLFIAALLLISLKAQATTTVTVDDNNRVLVNQAPVVVTQPIVTQPALVAVVENSADFEGEIEKIDRSARTMDVIDTEGRTRQVWVAQEAIDTYRTGDFVRIHPITGVREVTFIREESNRDLEGRIINVDSSQNTIVVRDAQSRDRRVKLKQGMISTYKVDDFVRIHLMADLKEAKMIRTIK
jgi:ribosomal protein L21E